MATVIYAPGNQPLGLGFRKLRERLVQGGYSVVVVDEGTTESLRDPLTTGVLREHALSDKDECVFFVGGERRGSRAVRTAAEYLWKHGESRVSGLILISPPVPLFVAPFRNILFLGKTVLEKVVLGNSLLGHEIQGLMDTPVFLRTCMYPTLHFYSASEVDTQQVLGRKLLAMSFTSSHPVAHCTNCAILDSRDQEVVIERIINWIDAIVLASRPMRKTKGLTKEAS